MGTGELLPCLKQGRVYLLLTDWCQGQMQTSVTKWPNSQEKPESLFLYQKKKKSMVISCYLILLLKTSTLVPSQNHPQVAHRPACSPPLTKRVTRNTYHRVPDGGHGDGITQMPASAALSFATSIRILPASFLSATSLLSPANENWQSRK